MISSFNDKIWGLSILSWILIIIILVFFIYKVFYTSKSDSTSEDESENFQGTNSPVDDDIVKVYNFNTSWCGWSVKFQPEWNKFSEEIKKNPDLNNIKAFDIKCDKPENEAVCKEFDVEGFPTVIIESDGRRGVYKGPRESKDLIETVKDL